MIKWESAIERRAVFVTALPGMVNRKYFDSRMPVLRSLLDPRKRESPQTADSLLYVFLKCRIRLIRKIRITIKPSFEPIRAFEAY